MPNPDQVRKVKTAHFEAGQAAVHECRPLTVARPIDSRSWQELLELQIRMGVGETFGVIEIPRGWVAAGTLQTRSYRIVDFRKIIPESIGVETEQGRALLIPIVRVALSIRFFDHLRKRNNGTSIQASTWLQHLRRLSEFAEFAISQRKPTDVKLFAGLDFRSIERFSSQDERRPQLIELISAIHEHGFLADWPDLKFDHPGATLENVESGEESLTDSVLPSKKKYQPLPDDFVSEAGRRAIWLIEGLGKTLLDCFEACNSTEVLRLSKAKRTYARAAIIKAWQWKTPDGRSIEKLPFKVLYGVKHAAPIQWCDPTRAPLFKRSKAGMVTYKQLLLLVNILQGAHLFVTSLAFGDRHSEQASLRLGVIVESASGDEYARGKTYKLAFRRGGVTQDWPLSDVTVMAIGQQERLSFIVRGSDASSESKLDSLSGLNSDAALWVKISTTGGNKHHGAEDGDPTLLNINSVYSTFLDSLDLGQYLTSEAPRLHQHRFRKTLARLIAIALVNAPEVLMMFFGHRSIEMTWQYIQTDRELQAEISQLAEHLMILNGVRIVENANSNGGPAAERVRDFVDSEKARHGTAVLNQSQLVEGALTLTAGGRIGNLVRPGVVCMKSPGDAGPCTKARGESDPARCRPMCDARLELGEAKYRQDVESNIVFVVRQWERANEEDDDLARSWAAGQICAQVPRFPDIRDRWINHPAVAKAMLSGDAHGAST